MLRYSGTILLSAFLLFQVQPLIAKKILPWFGGSPAVWTTCMLFFQLLLLVGYTYAHWISRYRGKIQLTIHGLFLCAALAFLPIMPAESWKPLGDESPSLRILLLLSVTVGLPYLLLSTTGPLLQRWFGETHPGRSPYRLFALSNFGSLLALLSYPILFEPTLKLDWQIDLWSGAFALFVLLCLISGWQIRSATFRETVPADEQVSAVENQTPSRPSKGTIGRWIALAMFPSIMLLATTNQMCQEVAVVPFLWVLPLSLYLISFIICFENERWYSRPIYGMLLILGIFLTCLTLPKGFVIPIPIEVGIYSATLFACCMTCHGELAKSKPTTQHLTLFYLAVSIGGALGGVFVVVVAEHLFARFIEFQLGLVGCLAMTYYCWWKSPDVLANPKLAGPAWKTLLGFLVLVVAFLTWETTYESGEVVARSRSFYGILTILERDDPDNGKYTVMRHGSINHGHQYNDSKKQGWKNCYYGEQSGVGLALRNHPLRVAGEPLKVGLIGLGTGIMAAYGQKGETYRFYEINPDVIRYAKDHFTYLSETPADAEVILGDARIVLEREHEATGSQNFDLIVMDAFSSDSIPMHLLTRESFELYTSHLSERGVLAVNISNNYLNLAPVVRRLGKELQLTSRLIEYRPGPEEVGQLPNNWIVLARDPAFFEAPELAKGITPWPKEMPDLLWTDDFGSLWSILSFSR